MNEITLNFVSLVYNYVYTYLYISVYLSDYNCVIYLTYSYVCTSKKKVNFN
jgi:hypothetical protein